MCQACVGTEVSICARPVPGCHQAFISMSFVGVAVVDQGKLVEHVGSRHSTKSWQAEERSCYPLQR